MNTVQKALEIPGKKWCVKAAIVQVFITYSKKNQIFWKVTQCRQISSLSYGRFGGIRLHLHSQVVDRIQHTKTATSPTNLRETGVLHCKTVPIFRQSILFEYRGSMFPQTSLIIQQSTQRKVSEDLDCNNLYLVIK